MFIFIVKYKKPMAEVEKFLAEHRSYLDMLSADGKLIASGPQEPRVGGIILCHTQTKEEVQKMVENDPFFIHDIADYEVIQFHAIKHNTDNFQAAFE